MVAHRLILILTLALACRDSAPPTAAAPEFPEGSHEPNPVTWALQSGFDTSRAVVVERVSYSFDLALATDKRRVPSDDLLPRFIREYRLAYGADKAGNGMFIAQLDRSEGIQDKIFPAIGRIVLTQDGVSAITTDGRPVRMLADSLVALLKQFAGLSKGTALVRMANDSSMAIAPGWRTTTKSSSALELSGTSQKSLRIDGSDASSRKAWLSKRSGEWELDSITSVSRRETNGARIASNSHFRRHVAFRHLADSARLLVRGVLENPRPVHQFANYSVSLPGLEPPQPSVLGPAPTCVNADSGGWRDHGSTPASTDPHLVLQHGFWTNASTWCRAVGTMDAYAAVRTTQLWTTGWQAAIADQAAVLRQKLDSHTVAGDSNQFPRPRLGIGHSMGGLVLRKVAQSANHRMSGVITVDSPNDGAAPAAAIAAGYYAPHLYSGVVQVVKAMWCPHNMICQLVIAGAAMAVSHYNDKVMQAWPSVSDLAPHSPFLTQLNSNLGPSQLQTGYYFRGFVANRIPNHFALWRLATEDFDTSLSSGAFAQFSAYVTLGASITTAMICAMQNDFTCVESALGLAAVYIAIDVFWNYVSGNFAAYPRGSDGFISYASQRELLTPQGVPAPGVSCDAYAAWNWWDCQSHVRNVYWNSNSGEFNSPREALDLAIRDNLLRLR